MFPHWEDFLRAPEYTRGAFYIALGFGLYWVIKFFVSWVIRKVRNARKG